MSLHRHTVGYRLSRVHEVSGLSPYESDGRERLSLGIKAHQILDAERRLRMLRPRPRRAGRLSRGPSAEDELGGRAQRRRVAGDQQRGHDRVPPRFKVVADLVRGPISVSCSSSRVGTAAAASSL